MCISNRVCVAVCISSRVSVAVCICVFKECVEMVPAEPEPPLSAGRHVFTEPICYLHSLGRCEAATLASTASSLYGLAPPASPRRLTAAIRPDTRKLKPYSPSPPNVCHKHTPQTGGVFRIEREEGLRPDP